jgi:Bax protein
MRVKIMPIRRFWPLIISVLVALLSFIIAYHYYFTARTAGSISDFSQYSDIEEKKAAFFAFVQPIGERANGQVMEQRRRLLSLEEQLTAGKKLSFSQQRWLQLLAKEYHLSQRQVDRELVQILLQRVDIVPMSLLLAQAANESAWGTSRFALEGNNLFGQWCFTAGCGLIPKDRAAGLQHEVAVFTKPEQSVASYVYNLNTHAAYQRFRQLRERQRQHNKPLSGDILAEGLIDYSARGEHYVAELQAMIRSNDLEQYDDW